MKRLALVGARGMVGKDLLKRLERFFICIPAGRQEFDVTKRHQVLQWIKEVRPDILINTAAYTDVDGCETHQDRAMLVNGEAVGFLAEGCAHLGTLMVHISTDFIFDGTQEGAYTEGDRPHPVSVYGTSKWLGEKRLLEHLGRFLIVRTSWLFGHDGKNFVETILTLTKERNQLSVVNDQTGSPTYVSDLSEAIINLLEFEVKGIVHVVNSGSCSWFDFAEKILECAGKRRVSLTAISSSKLGRPARRPANSVLSCERYFQTTGKRMRHWEEGLRDYLKKRKE